MGAAVLMAAATQRSELMSGLPEPEEHIDDVPASARPGHVAIIMDGNGRWAEARGLPRKLGHEQGVEAVRRTVEAAGELGLTHLTLYGFSSENWNRSVEEVNDLMGLLRLYIKRDLKELVKRGVHIRIIGERDSLAPDIIELIDDAESKSAANDKHFLTIAFNYGSRQEITTMVKRIAQRVAAGELKADDIDEAVIADYLYTEGLPELDLLIRTSGEKRLSNFLLWQAAYTELYFDDVLWPDYGRRNLVRAIRDFAARERRFGGRAGEGMQTSQPKGGAKVGGAG